MYHPTPIDTSEVVLSEELLALTEKIAENVHDVWAAGRIQEGWTYGPVKDSEAKTPAAVKTAVAEGKAAIDEANKPAPAPELKSVSVVYKYADQPTLDPVTLPAGQYSVVGTTLRVLKDWVETRIIDTEACTYAATIGTVKGVPEGDYYDFVLAAAPTGDVVVNVVITPDSSGTENPDPKPDLPTFPDWEEEDETQRAARTLANEGAADSAKKVIRKKLATLPNEKPAMALPFYAPGFELIEMIPVADESTTAYTVWLIRAEINQGVDIKSVVVHVVVTKTTVTPEPAAIPVKITVSDGKAWTEYVDITVNEKAVTALTTAKKGDEIAITAKTIEGKDVKVEPANITVNGDEKEIAITITVTDKTAVDQEVAVTAKNPSGVTVTVVDEAGKEVKTVTAKDGKLTLNAKVSKTGYKPVVMVDGEPVAFTLDETKKVWTLEMDVTADVKAVEVTARAYYTVTLTEELGASQKSVITLDKTSADVFTGEDVEFTATVNANGKQPSVKDAAAVISQNADKTWSIKFEKVAKSFDAKISATDNLFLKATSEKKVELVDADLKAGKSVVITGGTYTILADAPEGVQPCIGSGENIKYFEPAKESDGEPATGMKRWSYTEKNVTEHKNITVTGEDQLHAVLKTESAGIVIVPGEYTSTTSSGAYVIKSAENYTVTFEGVGIYSSYILSLKGGNQGTIVTTKTGVDEKNKNIDLYTITYTSSEAYSKGNVEITVEKSSKKNVRMTTTAEQITINGTKTSVVGATETGTKYANGKTEPVNYAKFALTVAEGYYPAVKAEEQTKEGAGLVARFAPVEGSATEWEAWVVPGENAETAVTLVAKQIPQVELANKENTDVIDIYDVTEDHSPFINMTVEAQAVQSAADQKDAWNWSGISALTFKAEITGIKTTIDTKLNAVPTDKDNVACKVTPEDTTASEFTLDVTAKSAVTGNVKINLSAAVGEKITIAVDENYKDQIDITGVQTTQYKQIGETVTFTVRLTDKAPKGVSILASEGMPTENADGSWTITLKVSKAADIILKAGEAQGFNWRVESPEKGVLVYPDKGGFASGNITFDVTLAAGYTLTAKEKVAEDEAKGPVAVTVKNGKEEVKNLPEGALTVENNPGTDVWTIALKLDGVKADDVTFEITPVEDDALKLTINPGRIWNAYKSEQDKTTGEWKATGDRINDTMKASGLYETYEVNANPLVREADGSYSMKINLVATNIIKHWNGAPSGQSRLGWWSGICIEVPTGVTEVTFAGDLNGKATAGKILCEVPNGVSDQGVATYAETEDKTTAKEVENAVSGYINAEKSGEKNFTITYKVGEVEYTIAITVVYTVTHNEKTPYVYDMEGNVVEDKEEDKKDGAEAAMESSIEPSSFDPFEQDSEFVGYEQSDEVVDYDQDEIL